jgi:hypothetical protein
MEWQALQNSGPLIDLRIASLDDPIEATDDPADRVPDPPTVPPLSKVGDLWLLGPHHLLCGDARDPAAFAALMGEERAAMVFTDPPYNVPDRRPCQRPRRDPLDHRPSLPSHRQIGNRRRSLSRRRLPICLFEGNCSCCSGACRDRGRVRCCAF